MPLCHILIVRSHLVTVSVLFRRIMLVDLRLWSASLSSTSTRTSLIAAAAGVILLRIMTLFPALCRSTSCALTD